jgi:hypothetical protein
MSLSACICATRFTFTIRGTLRTSTLNCPVVIPALLGEVVLSGVNSSLDTWDQSAGGTLIERRVVDWTARRIGFGPGADGVFTSGGTQSNLQGLLLARDERCVVLVVRVSRVVTAGSGLRCWGGCGLWPRRVRTSAW